jgi:RNA polymerase sigma-70 factor (ECF subfamily)
MEDISRDIIEQAQTGDRKAFEHIYRLASGFVYNVALRITNNQEEAQEVAQDVFLKIYRHLKDFAFRSSFKTWAYRITVNTALDAYNRMKKEFIRRQDFDTVMDTVAAPIDTGKDIAEQEERALNQKRLEALLNKLNLDQRTCIILREIQGLSYQEIAQTLNINLNTVRTRLKRGREALLAYSQRR